MSRDIKLVLISVLAGAVLLLATIVAVRAAQPNDQEQAANWAQRACSHYAPSQAATPGVSGEPAPAPTDPAQETTNWQTVADDAAHAARLDPVWQNLAMAANAQLEEWQAAANGKQPAAALAAAAEQYNINVECRKAMD